MILTERLCQIIVSLGDSYPNTNATTIFKALEAASKVEDNESELYELVAEWLSRNA